MSRSASFPISSNKINTCSHCVSCKNYEWSRKRMKKVFFWVSEISKHQNVRWVATYVNFDICKLGLLKQTLLKQSDFDLHPSLNRHKFTAAFQTLAEGQKLFSWRIDEMYSARERPEQLLLYQPSASWHVGSSTPWTFPHHITVGRIVIAAPCSMGLFFRLHSRCPYSCWRMKNKTKLLNAVGQWDFHFLRLKAAGDCVYGRRRYPCESFRRSCENQF